MMPEHFDSGTDDGFELVHQDDDEADTALTMFYPVHREPKTEPIVEPLPLEPVPPVDE